MPVEPIKIPQNVYIEDRIVGPLTLKQVIIVALGGGFSYAMFAMVSKTYGTLALPIEIIVWIPGILSVIFAFVKVNDLSMLRLCMLFLERMNKPSIRTWTPRRGIIINIRTFHTAKADAQGEKTTVIKERSQQKIDELSTILDRPVKQEEVQPTMQELKEDEPMDDADIVLDDNPNVVGRRPVDKSRIVATPLRADSVDAITPPSSGSISIFRDISTTH